MKKPLTIDEQIEHLKSNKNVVFEICNEENAKNILLNNNYIHVITPFKHYFHEKEKNMDNKHVYLVQTDFQRYYDKYLRERSRYTLLLSNILKFEHQLNSVFSYYVIHYYAVTSNNEFEQMILNFYQEKETITDSLKPSTENAIKEIENLFEKYNKNIFLTLNQLSLGRMLLIFRLLPVQVKNQIIQGLNNHQLISGMSIDQFVQRVFRLQEIRNCLAHNNSLEIRINYFNIENKQLRHDTDIKRYRSLLNKIERI